LKSVLGEREQGAADAVALILRRSPIEY